MADKDIQYIHAPFRKNTAKRIKVLAKKNNRSLGQQIVWMIERFLEER